MNEEKCNPMSCNENDEVCCDTLRSMVRDFYNRKMLLVVIVTWFWSLVFIAVAVWSAIMFFRVNETKSQILFAVIFLFCTQFMAMMKIFAWQMIHKNGIKREIRKLEKRIAEIRGM